MALKLLPPPSSMRRKDNRGTLVPSKISLVKSINTLWHVSQSPYLLRIVVVLCFLLPNFPANELSRLF